MTVNIPYGYSSSNAATAAKNIYRFYYGYTDLNYILNNSALNSSNVEIGDYSTHCTNKKLQPGESAGL